MEEQINHMLDMMGINKNEAKVYLDLLKNKPSTSLELSKRTGIHRSNTYDSIRNLIGKGFASEIIGEKRKEFKALPPEKIKHHFEQKVRELDQILPSLNNFSKESTSKSSFVIIDGISSIREKISDLLNLDKDINIYGLSKPFLDVLGKNFLKEFNKERLIKKIFLRGISDENSLDHFRFLNEKKYTQIKSISNKYSSEVMTIMCEDLMLILTFNENIQGIIMQNNLLSEAYKNYFDIFCEGSVNL